jgi:hypothetical protein
VPVRSLISGFEVGNSDAKFQVLEIFDSPEIVLVTTTTAATTIGELLDVSDALAQRHRCPLFDVAMTPGELAESGMNLKTCLAPHWSTFSAEIQELEEAGIIM